MAKWAGGRKSSSNMMPPYTPEEISQSLSGHNNFDILTVYKLKMLEGHLKWGTLPADKFV